MDRGVLWLDSRRAKKVRIKIIDNRLAQTGYPFKGSEQAAGIDLCACIYTPVELFPGEVMQITTGISVELDEDTVGLLLPRSGKGVKGLVLANNVGVIDADYRGIVIAACLNRNAAGMRPIEIKPLDRIAQLVVVPLVEQRVEVVDELTKTERGSHGLGSRDGLV